MAGVLRQASRARTINLKQLLQASRSRASGRWCSGAAQEAEQEVRQEAAKRVFGDEELIAAHEQQVRLFSSLSLSLFILKLNISVRRI